MWSIMAAGACGAACRSGAVELREFGQHCVQRQALGFAGVLQRHLATAAEVELQAAKHGGGAGQVDGDLSNGLLGAVVGGGVAHGLCSLKVHLV
jgi:hypothetical protein